MRPHESTAAAVVLSIETSDTNPYFALFFTICQSNFIKLTTAGNVFHRFMALLRMLKARTTICAPQTYALIYAQVKDSAMTPSTEKSN